MIEDETVVSSTTQPTETVPDVTSTGNSSAGTENTATPAEHMIPKSRFDEVNERRKAAEQASTQLKERLEALERRVTESDKPRPGETPEETEERIAARKMIESDARALLEREFGMPLADIKSVLSNASTTSRSYVQAEWDRRCRDSGLDPANREVQELVYGLGKAGVALDDAFERAKKLYAQPSRPEPPTANVGDNGVSTVMTAEGRVPRTRDEAMAMAKQGQRAPHVSSQELIDRAIAASKPAVVRRD